MNDMGVHGQMGFGEVSGARVCPVGIDKFGMLGVCTAMGDGLGGLVLLLERTSAISPAGDRTSVSRVPGLISRNPIGFEGGKGPRICLGIGCTGGKASRPVELLANATPNLQDDHLEARPSRVAESKLRGE